MGEDIHLNEIDVVFGFFRHSAYSKSLNLCILIAKQFIVNYKYYTMKPSLYALLLRIKTYVQLERYICARNDNLQAFFEFEKLYEEIG